MPAPDISPKQFAVERSKANILAPSPTKVTKPSPRSSASPYAAVTTTAHSAYRPSVEEPRRSRNRPRGHLTRHQSESRSDSEPAEEYPEYQESQLPFEVLDNDRIEGSRFPPPYTGPRPSREHYSVEPYVMQSTRQSPRQQQEIPYQSSHMSRGQDQGYDVRTYPMHAQNGYESGPAFGYSHSIPTPPTSYRHGPTSHLPHDIMLESTPRSIIPPGYSAVEAPIMNRSPSNGYMDIQEYRVGPPQMEYQMDYQMDYQMRQH